MAKIVIATCSIIFLCTDMGLAQESRYKALFIYKFAELIQWPDGNKNITIGIAGKSDVLDELKKVTAAKANLTVITLSSASEASKCQIVFIPNALIKSAPENAKVIGDKSILLVTDDADLLATHSDIGFFIENDQLRFTINEKSIQAKKMFVSSKLLTLGKPISN